MNFQILIKQIQSVQSALQSTAAHTINVALTVRNWLIGYYIVEFEQHDEDRATESEMEIRRTSAEFQTPENKDNKWSLSAKILLSKLSYSHLDKLSQIDTPIKKVFYEMECIKGCWSIAELERQINTLYYERSGLSKNNEGMMPEDNLPVGILLCADKGNTQVKYATAGLDENIFVQKYLIELPDENTLSEYVTKEFLLIESEK